MLRRIFITGFVALIPIIITVYVLVGLFRFADGILGKFINTYCSLYFGCRIPGLGIILSLCIIFLVGLILSLSRMRLFNFFERLFIKIPLTKGIYFPVKRIVNFLFLKQPERFRGVALVEYPRKGIYSIGFVTNESPFHLAKTAGKNLYNIFIPSSPSPLTGFTIIVPEEEIMFLDMTMEDATKIIVSGGMFNPGQDT